MMRRVFRKRTRPVPPDTRRFLSHSAAVSVSQWVAAGMPIGTADGAR